MHDLHNSAGQLTTQLKRIRYRHLSSIIVEKASVADLLRILHYALLEYSHHVTKFIQSHGYDLYGKNDAAFITSVFRLLRDEFRYFPSMNVTQFLASGHFTERKLVLTAEILRLVIKKHEECQRKKRLEQAMWSKSPPETPTEPVRVENHMLPSAIAHVDDMLRRLQRTQRPQKNDKAPKHIEFNAHDEKFPDDAVHDNQEEDRWADHHHQDFEVVNHKSIQETTCPPVPVVVTQCNCFQHIESMEMRMAEKMDALSQQLNDLSTALLTKMSSIETKLHQLENQVEHVSSQVQQAAEKNRFVSKEDQDDNKWMASTTNVTQSSVDDEDDDFDVIERLKQLNVHLDRCSWPPEPMALNY